MPIQPTGIIGGQCKSGIAWAGGASASSLLTGLVHYWTLDETSGTRADSVGSASLSDINTVGSAAGVHNDAAAFVTANHEYLSGGSTICDPGNTDFTFAFWVYSTLPGGVFLSRDNSTSPRSYTVDLLSATTARWYINGGAGADLISNATFSAFAWHHFVASWQASTKKISLTIDDGTPATGTTTNTPPSGGTTDFRLGARQYVGAEGYMSGRLDEVGYWSRILTPAEITTLYNSGTGKFYPSF